MGVYSLLEFGFKIGFILHGSTCNIVVLELNLLSFYSELLLDYLGSLFGVLLTFATRLYCGNVAFQDGAHFPCCSVSFFSCAVLGQQASCCGSNLVLASFGSLVSPGLPIRSLSGDTPTG